MNGEHHPGATSTPLNNNNNLPAAGAVYVAVHDVEGYLACGWHIVEELAGDLVLMSPAIAGQSP